jgi:hypothetical protein
MPARRLIPRTLVALLVLAAGCGILVRRDLSGVPAGQIGFDDMCGLQEYFDTLEIHVSPPPRLVSGLDLEQSTGTKTIHGGRERYAFENEFQLKHVRRVLKENWKRLPDGVDGAKRIELEVHWSEKAGTKRVATDRAAELTIDGASHDLPYQICLSELLYGEPLYRQRRLMWGLPLLPGHKLGPDGGTVPDGGAAAPAVSGGADARPADAQQDSRH